jgi:hypothetical protein
MVLILSIRFNTSIRPEGEDFKTFADLNRPIFSQIGLLSHNLHIICNNILDNLHGQISYTF